MGAANRKKTKKQKLLEEQPICIFCNQKPSRTIDHVPSREFFISRIGPEGYEFGSCQSCNHSSAQMEQVAAVYAHSNSELEGDNIPQQFEKLYRGLENNNPAGLPEINLSANEKRKAAQNFYAFPEPIETYADAPMVGIPSEAKKSLQIFNRKLACALYFRETTKILPLTAMIATLELPLGHKSEKRIVDFAKANLTNLTKTERRNTNIGNQFFYAWASSSNNELFSYTAQFHKSYVCFGAIALDNSRKFHSKWKPHQCDIDNDWQI
jgi:hypothetical protein